jgi:hypothetical protein
LGALLVIDAGITVACGPGQLFGSTRTPTPTNTPTSTNTATSTDTPTSTITPTASPTPEPTPTETVFVPEGFTVGELGLLKNPENGQNALRLNPEADWTGFRQLIIENIWQVNMDWLGITSFQTQVNQFNKEQFLKKALAGEELIFGIPVRADTKGAEKLTWYYGGIYVGPYAGDGGYTYTGDMKLATVEARLDNIQIQVADPTAFKDYLGGKDWTASEQEAYTPIGGDNYKKSACTAILFAEKDGQLVITLGSYYFLDDPKLCDPHVIGRFDAEIHEKYPSYFREDGLGIEADNTSSIILGFAIEELQYFSHSRQRNGYGGLVFPLSPEGNPIYSINVIKVQVLFFDDSWLTWNLFAFSH